MSESAKGKAAYQSGDYETAIQHFTQALADEGESHLLYSNRSAAYCQLKQYAKAIEDADRCIQLQPNWGKGYSRKATALYESGRYAEAYNAFQRGLLVEPDNATLRAGLENALRKIQGSTSSSASSGPGRAAAAAGGTVKQILTRDYIETALFALHIVNLLLFLVSLIPFGGVGSAARRFFMLLSIVRFALFLYQQHGMPRFNMQYAQTLLMDPSAPYLFLAILMFMSRPYLLPTLPLVFVQAFHFGIFFYPLAQALNPPKAAELANMVDDAFAKALQNPGWPQLTYVRKKTELWNAILDMSARFEVFHGIYLIVELFLPSRNLLALMMFWQFLQLRYMLEQARGDTSAVRNAFKFVDTKILSWTNHPNAPAFLRTGYNYVRNFLASKVQMPQPGQQPAQRTCTIM